MRPTYETADDREAERDVVDLLRGVNFIARNTRCIQLAVKYPCDWAIHSLDQRRLCALFEIKVRSSAFEGLNRVFLNLWHKRKRINLPVRT